MNFATGETFSMTSLVGTLVVIIMVFTTGLLSIALSLTYPLIDKSDRVEGEEQIFDLDAFLKRRHFVKESGEYRNGFVRVIDICGMVFIGHVINDKLTFVEHTKDLNDYINYFNRL